MEETHPSFLWASTDLLIPVSKIISRPIGVGTTKGLLVSPSIGYNHGIFVCSHHFIYCWLKAIHFYRSYLSSGFRARCEMELISPVVSHLETVLLVLAVADFYAFQFAIKTQKALRVDLLDGNSLRRHAAFVFGPAKDEPAGFQSQISGYDVDSVHRVRVFFVSAMEMR